MAATISATLHSTNLKHPPPTHFLTTSSDPIFTIPCITRVYSHSSLKCKVSNGIEPLWITRRTKRTRSVSAAVAQEEAEAAVEEEEEEELKGGTKLYFGNLPFNCDSASLAGIVQEFAEPELVEVLYDRETGRSRGYAFVTMSSVEDCEKVIQNLDKSELGGRYVRVNFADKPRSKEPLFPETDYRLFVGNLSWTVTSEIMREAFKEVGEVVGARVIFDGETGRSKGYGFVSYRTKEAMEAALESLDGMEVEGRPIRISIAEGRK